MNPEIKEQWVATLRSGDYRQGKDELRNLDNTYCCLGVLCDLAVQAGVAKWEHKEKVGVESWFCGPVSADLRGEASSFLPNVVRVWAELSLDNPFVPNPDINADIDLASLNDAGKTFWQIADLIEEHL